MFITKLTISNLLARRMRATLTVAAVAFSVSLVVSVTSGYSSALAAVHKFLATYMGSVDVMITRPSSPGGGVSERVSEALRTDPRVKRVIGRVEMHDVLEPQGGVDDEAKSASILGITRPDDFLTQNLSVEAGKWFDGDDGDVAVIDQSAAEGLKIAPGDSLVLPGFGKKLKVTVVGIVHKPSVMAEHHRSVYLPLRTLQRFADFQGKVSRVLVELQPGVDAEKFTRQWTPKLALMEPFLKVRSADETKRQTDRQLEAVHLLSYMGGAVSMLAATFIIFSALSMGVTERQRTLAMLRAIGAFRRQVAALVVIEGMLLAGIGSLAGVGLGWLWVHILAWKFPQVFVVGVVLSWGGILLGVGGSLLAALAASLLPAWSASRVSALEAMSPHSSPSATRLPLATAAIGLFLAAVDPYLLQGPLGPIASLLGPGDPADALMTARLVTHFVLGLPAMMLGFFLLSPLFVWVTERLAGPAVAGLFGIRFAVLRQQLSSGIWRAAGTCTALMVGLATLIVLQVQGHSALSGWQLPNKFPDVLIGSYSPAGIKAEDVARLDDVKGIRRGEVMPIAIALPGLSHGFFGMAQAMIMPDATMFFGIDPEKGLRLMALDFREGNAIDAVRLLKSGRHIMVTNEFRKLKNLHVGDKLQLATTHGPTDYTICGVIWSPGLDVLGSMYDMGMQMDQRTAASVFGTLEDARADFGIDSYHMLVANLEYGTDKAAVVKEVEKSLKAQGMRVWDARQIKEKIQNSFYNLLLMVSAVAFSAMAVASLGVTNTIMASIRSRRWQFGILRSIGVTRSVLTRLILAEATLLGLIASALGIAAGALLSRDAHILSGMVTGYDPPLAVPYGIIGIGIGIVLLISMIASIAPALGVAAAEPLSLLQAGRSSA